MTGWVFERAYCAGEKRHHRHALAWFGLRVAERAPVGLESLAHQCDADERIVELAGHTDSYLNLFHRSEAGDLVVARVDRKAHLRLKGLVEFPGQAISPMRDRETIDSELRLMAAVRRSIREHGGEPSSRQVDTMLDERLANLGRAGEDAAVAASSGA
jgi:hypothetical protein